ncbi:MAG: S8/S53 family peptidase [Lachnospiraceae bacterium]|nr:S8/S53 family peptidase [Lachnospiraceae bacterium]
MWGVMCEMARLKIAVLDSGVDVACIQLINNNIYSLVVNERNGVYQIENSIINEEQHGSLIIREILNGVENDKCEIYSIKILDDNLNCDVEKLIFALDYVYRNIKPNIINLSLGYKKENIQVYNIIKRIIGMGTLIVAAYDNENEESFPAKYPEVIGVKGIKKNNDPKRYIYDEKENNIYLYNGTRRFDLPGKGYKYIIGNSIACASITAYIANILCMEDLGISQIYSRLAEKSSSESEIEFNPCFHKSKERILLYPLNIRTLNKTDNLKKYCSLCGFLDFRKYIFTTIRDNTGNEYPIFNSFEDIPKEIDYIYVDELIDCKSSNISKVYEKILKGALVYKINLSFYERPDSYLLERFSYKFNKEKLNIEFVNVFERL